MADEKDQKRDGQGRIHKGGMPKGHVTQKVLDREAHEAALRQRIAEDAGEFYEALRTAAVGVTHMMAKDKDGTWKEVTDPAVMAKVLNSGDAFYRISARNPDVRALIDVFNRLCGPPTHQIAAKVEHRLTLEDLIAGSND